MVALSVESLVALAALSVSLGAALFWLGHLRADVLRLQDDVRVLQRDVHGISLEVAALSRSEASRPMPSAILKVREDEEGSE